jgi:hypothetical protein
MDIDDNRRVHLSRAVPAALSIASSLIAHAVRHLTYAPLRNEIEA